jgi:GMP synthase (glutamine-hydrolysing)
MQTVIIVKAGSTFPAIEQRFGDFEDWVIKGCGLPGVAFSVIDMMKDRNLPPAEGLSGVIITGSPAMVTDQAPWMQTLASWIPQVLERQIPLLGICFGHQILAHAMGGSVAYHPGGREIGSVSIALTPAGKQDILLGSLPDVFMAHATHAQTVTQLPLDTQVLAGNSYESRHAFRIGKNAWGVQFHPEFSAEIMAAYISEQAAPLLGAGYDINALHEVVCNTGEANGLLKRFMKIVGQRTLIF